MERCARKVLSEAEGAARGPRTRERAARPGEEAVLRAVAAAAPAAAAGGVAREVADQAAAAV